MPPLQSPVPRKARMGPGGSILTRGKARSSRCCLSVPPLTPRGLDPFSNFHRQFPPLALKKWPCF